MLFDNKYSVQRHANFEKDILEGRNLEDEHPVLSPPSCVTV